MRIFKAHNDNSTSAYEVVEGKMECFVGVSDEPSPECDINKVDHLILTSGKEWPYFANCDVDMSTGAIEFGECRIPMVISADEWYNYHWCF